MKTLTRKLAAFGFVALSMWVAIPASANPGTCPTGWEVVFVSPNTPADSNNNGLACAKSVGGNGNAGGQANYVDDRTE